MIEVFTSESCPFCHILKELLTKNAVDFTEKPIEVHENEIEFKKYNIEAYPLTKITSTDSIALIVGAQPEKIMKVNEYLSTVNKEEFGNG